jgi:CheY-like chemotaxis protein
MPDMDGLTVLRELQADAQTRAIPVIIATSLPVTGALRARLPAGIRVLPKDGMTRDTMREALSEATEPVELS